jgi:hypothetical protein
MEVVLLLSAGRDLQDFKRPTTGLKSTVEGESSFSYRM